MDTAKKQKPKSTREILSNQNVGDFVKRMREKGIVEDSEKRSGIIIPNASQIPNEIIDKWMPHLTEAELKVLIYMCRKTFGYNKIDGDYISLSQLTKGVKKRTGEIQDEGTGLSKQSVIDAIKALERFGLVKTIRKNTNDGGKHINHYRVLTRTI